MPEQTTTMAGDLAGRRPPRRHTVKRPAILAATCLLLATLAPAALPAQGAERVAVELGQFGLDGAHATFVGIEALGRTMRWGVRPVVGALLTEEADGYAYAGLARPVRLGRATLTPSFAVGLYGRGEGADLGGAVQFRSAVELGVPTRRGPDVSLRLSHLSNGGIYDDNPGTETLSLRLEWPTRR